MGLKNDRWIREKAGQGMITPFEPYQVREVDGRRVVSFGVSSYGYDIRLRREFKLFTNVDGATIDPHAFDDKAFVDRVGDFVVIPPNSFVLGGTVECFDMPRNVLAICVGKSTLARCGLVVNITPLEPGWRGHLTVEVSNTTTLPAKLYANEGVAQLLFFEADEPCETSYSDRGGKYQEQPGIVLPIV
jgi:dCTP deaminase